ENTNKIRDRNSQNFFFNFHKPGFSSLQAFQNEVTCTICMTCFINWVTIACGHNFCRPCLCLCWEEGRAPLHCPACREISEKSNFKTNVALKKLAFLARQPRLQRNIHSSDKLSVRHEETKELFGEADRRLLCGPSSESPEPMAHSHSPIGWAADESRDKLTKEMDYLWKINQETQSNLNQETSNTHLIVVRMKMFPFVFMQINTMLAYNF
ncbi:tripartite motif-containing protein 64-like, partial [Sapajus apella]|uniref:Tripartite motif-containing protein 64-like n=1 Tax=Sapajus apella TaxID=9515 RepID=A0A6J3HH13_SAPAP